MFSYIISLVDIENLVIGRMKSVKMFTSKYPKIFFKKYYVMYNKSFVYNSFMYNKCYVMYSKFIASRFLCFFHDQFGMKSKARNIHLINL